MPALIMTILSLIASARGGNDSASAGLSQLGSSLSGLMNNLGSKSSSNPNLTQRGYPSSHFGYFN